MRIRVLAVWLIFLQLLSVNHNSALAEAPKNYLKGKFFETIKDHFLVATDKMTDPRFKKTVIVMLDSDKDGAWGFVVNKPMGSVPIDLLINFDPDTPEKKEELHKINIPIFWGGPVEVKKIFVLHSTEYKTKSTKNYGNISISKDYNILFDIAENKGPKKSLVILGYSGWGSGQLEGEMERDHWILSNLNNDIIFEKDSIKKWPKAHKHSFIRL